MDDKKETTPAPAESPEPAVEDIRIEDDTAPDEEPKEDEELPPAASSSGTVPVGKQHKGDVFPAAKSPEQIAEETAAQTEMNKEPDCVPIEVYFSLRNINDPGAKAARLRYTSLRNAPLEKWDAIFEKAF